MSSKYIPVYTDGRECWSEHAGQEVGSANTNFKSRLGEEQTLCVCTLHALPQSEHNVGHDVTAFTGSELCQLHKAGKKVSKDYAVEPGSKTLQFQGRQYAAVAQKERPTKMQQKCLRLIHLMSTDNLWSFRGPNL